MSDVEDEGRLIIDDHNIDINFSAKQEVAEFSDNKTSDTSFHIAEMDEPRVRKTISNSSLHTLSDQTIPSSVTDNLSFKEKDEASNKSACSLSRALNGQVSDESQHLLFSLKPGSNIKINLTLLYKASSNVFYVSSKWKDKEYYGILTDGEPIHHSHSMKRASCSSSNSKEIDYEKNEISEKIIQEKTKHKTCKRSIPKNFDIIPRKRPVEAGISDAANASINGGDVNTLALCIPQTTNGSNNKKFSQCPQCAQSFEGIDELNFHFIVEHLANTKRLIYESVATQTDMVNKVSVGCDSFETEEKPQLFCSSCTNKVLSKSQDKDLNKCTKQLEKSSTALKTCKSINGSPPPSEFSDISENSDDGRAPTLEKEESFESNARPSGSLQSHKKMLSSNELLSHAAESSKNYSFLSERTSSPTLRTPSRKMGIGDIETVLKKTNSPSTLNMEGREGLQSSHSSLSKTSNSPSYKFSSENPNFSFSNTEQPSFIPGNFSNAISLLHPSLTTQASSHLSGITPFDVHLSSGSKVLSHTPSIVSPSLSVSNNRLSSPPHSVNKEQLHPLHKIHELQQYSVPESSNISVNSTFGGSLLGASHSPTQSLRSSSVNEAGQRLIGLNVHHSVNNQQPIKSLNASPNASSLMPTNFHPTSLFQAGLFSNPQAQHQSIQEQFNYLRRLIQLGVQPQSLLPYDLLASLQGSHPQGGSSSMDSAHARTNNQP